jgi:hypothetical protein
LIGSCATLNQVAPKVRVEKSEAEWRLRFANLLLSTGEMEVGLAVRVAHAAYQGAALLSPEEALLLLRDTLKEAGSQVVCRF